jgi:predicted CXXCH cytochrome family protein
MKSFNLVRPLRTLFLGMSILISAYGFADAAKVCYDCHQKEKAEYGSKKNIHAPVKAENCESCHKRHGFSNKLILNDVSNQLCFSCHADLKDKYSAGSVHSPLTAGVCWDCHDPHASDKKALLLKGPAEADDPSSCFGCHKDQLASSTKAKFPHEPFEKQDCVLCHDPHNSPNARLLKKDANTLCASCHQVTDKKFVAAHDGKFIQGLGCADCHSGHSSNSKGLLSATGHPPFQEGTCDVCHSLPDANGKIAFAEGTNAGSICANCHADQSAGPTKKHPHPAVEAANCNTCHSGHSSPYGNLLRQSEKTLCAQCHADIGADSTKSHHTPVADGQCGKCHDIHGSDNDKLLRRPMLHSASNVTPGLQPREIPLRLFTPAPLIVCSVTRHTKERRRRC